MRARAPAAGDRGRVAVIARGFPVALRRPEASRRCAAETRALRSQSGQTVTPRSRKVWISASE
jgi:hypothetical protein